MMRAKSIAFNAPEFTTQLQTYCTGLLEWLQDIRKLPVSPPHLDAHIAAFTETTLPEAGLGLTGAVSEFRARVAPGLANTAGPRAFPWVIGGVTPGAFLGALYQVQFDQINMVSGASIAPKLESETINLLLDLFDLPREGFTGTLTTGATASNISGLACARQWWGHQHGINIADVGMSGLPPIEVYSACPHASVDKALGILGCGRKSLIRVKRMPGREAVDLASLAEHLSKSTAKAKIVAASAGTVNTADFDALRDVAAICREHNAWLHVDAAFGLFAKCHPAFTALADAVELADSITADAHKWLNVPYDCGILFVKKDHKPHLVSSFSSVADYMSQAADEPMNKGIENSRALRALAVWMTLKTYGREGYRELIERNCAFASAAATSLSELGDYELLAPVRLNVVLFHAKGIATAAENAQLIKHINATGKIFITGTVYDGMPGMRIAICNWQTDIGEDLSAVVEALAEGMAAYKSGGASTTPEEGKVVALGWVPPVVDASKTAAPKL